MNILHIISAPASGGAEVYVKDLVKSLSKQGHCMHIAFVSSAEDLGRNHQYSDNFIEDLKKSNINTYIIGHECKKKPWLGAFRIKKYIENNKIDICHTHLAYGILFSTLIKVPVIYTHHTIKPRWNKFIYSIFNRVVDQYIGISEICARALSSFSGREVYTIRNAVSEEKFIGLTRQRSLEDTVNLVMVGRLIREKDYLNILEALTLLDTRILSKLKLTVAGEGDEVYRNKIVHYINHHELEDKVELIGVTNNIPELLYKSDLFIMSSCSEGLPIALTEAAVSGLPCIVTDVGGCSEIINLSQNGIIVPPHDSASIAQAINKLVSTPNLISSYSENALRHAHNYSIHNATLAHINIYEKLIKTLF